MLKCIENLSPFFSHFYLLMISFLCICNSYTSLTAGRIVISVFLLFRKNNYQVFKSLVLNILTYLAAPVAAVAWAPVVLSAVAAAESVGAGHSLLAPFGFVLKIEMIKRNAFLWCLKD